MIRGYWLVVLFLGACGKHVLNPVPPKTTEEKKVTTDAPDADDPEDFENDLPVIPDGEIDDEPDFPIGTIQAAEFYGHWSRCANYWKNERKKTMFSQYEEIFVDGALNFYITYYDSPNCKGATPEEKILIYKLDQLAFEENDPVKIEIYSRGKPLNHRLTSLLMESSKVSYRQKMALDFFSRRKSGFSDRFSDLDNKLSSRAGIGILRGRRYMYFTTPQKKGAHLTARGLSRKSAGKMIYDELAGPFWRAR